MTAQSNVKSEIILLLIVVWGLWTFSIGDTFYLSRDTTVTWVAGAVRNLEYYEFNTIGLSVVRNTYQTNDINALRVYSHHPPLNVWIPALVSRFIGDNELALRFASPVAMMIGVCGFYVFVRRLHGYKIAFWSVLLFAISPMISYHEVSFYHDPLGFMVALIYSAIFIHWLKYPAFSRYIGLVLMTILAVWTAWPAVFFVATFGLFGFVIGQNTHRIGVVILGIITILAFSLMMLLYEWWWAGSVSSILEAFFYRTSAASTTVGTEPFTLLDWLLATSHHLTYYGTVSVIVFALLGTRYIYMNQNRFSILFTIALLASGLLYITVFRNASFVHIYYKAFLMPGLVILSAYGLVYFRKSSFRIAKPLVDGLILAFFIQTVLVLMISYQTPNRTSVENLADFIISEVSLPEPVYVLFPDSAYRTYMPLEYYTNTRLNWNILLEDIPDTNETFTFILCYEDQTYVEYTYNEPQSSITIDDLCSAYFLNGTPHIRD